MYFDSNDEMYYENEASIDFLDSSHDYHQRRFYSRLHQTTEEERKRIRE